jgi:hypothetical protein
MMVEVVYTLEGAGLLVLLGLPVAANESNGSWILDLDRILMVY